MICSISGHRPCGRAEIYQDKKTVKLRQMYSAGTGDNRATAPSNGRDSSSSMHLEHSSTWDSQVFTREKFDHGERERSMPGKKEWEVERAAAGIACQKPTSVISDSGGLLGSSSKRQAVARHCTSTENGRYGGGSSRPNHSSSLGGLASQSENVKTGRVTPNTPGNENTRSPGYGGKFSAERLNKEQEDGHGSEQSLATSPVLDYRLGSHHAQATLDCSGLWDRERSKSGSSVGWDTPQWAERDIKERTRGMPDFRRAGIPLKLDSSRDWGLGDKELEGRLDRYGSGLNREYTSADALAGSKEYARRDWRTRERTMSSTLSSWGSALPSGNGYAKEVGIQSVALDVSGCVSSPQDSALLMSCASESGNDLGMGTSPRKRPRLGWGQGLAKYEKEKVEEAEDHSLSKKKIFGESVLGNDRAPCDDVLSEGDQSSVSPQHHGTPSVSSISMPPSASAHTHLTVDHAFESLNEFGPGSGSFDCLHKENDKDLQGHFDRVGLEPLSSIRTAGQDDISMDVKGFASDILPEMHSKGLTMILATSQSRLNLCDSKTTDNVLLTEDILNWSKEMMLQRLEKVELEIDLVEKELAKIEKDMYNEDWGNKDAQDADGEAEGHLGTLPTAFLGIMEQSSRQLGEECLQTCVDIVPAPACTEDLLCSTSDPHLADKAEDSMLQDQTCTSKLADDDVGVLENFNKVQECSEHLIDNKDLAMEASAAPLKEEALKASEEGLMRAYPNILLHEKPKCINDLVILDGKTCEKSISSLILANEELAKHSFEPLLHLSNRHTAGGIKLYSSPKEASIWQENLRNHERNKKHLVEKVDEENRFLVFKEKILAMKYRVLREYWKQEHFGIGQQKDRSKAPRRWEMDCWNAASFLGLRSSLRLRPGLLGSSRTDAVLSEEGQLVKKLLFEPVTDYQRPYLRMPAMTLDEKKRDFQRFVSSNGLVEDPVALEQERKAINPWSAEEKRIFLEKYSAFGKNFSKIASFLEQKTIADCVEFYYRNQKTEDFEKVRRRQQIKKRRDYSRVSASYLATTTSGSSRHREAMTAHVEGLTLVAAAAAAVDASKDYAKVVRSSSNKTDRARLPPVDFGSSENPALPKSFYGKEKSAANASMGSGASALVASSGAVSSTIMKSVGERNSLDWGSIPFNLEIKGNNVEHHSGIKGARTFHTRSLKASSVEEVDSQWTDNERELFTAAVRMFGKNFKRISMHVGSKSQAQCKSFFSKTRKRLGLDQLVEQFNATFQVCSEVTIDYDAKQKGDLKSQFYGGIKVAEPVSDCSAPLSVNDIENIHTERIEQQQGRLELIGAVAEESQILSPNNLLGTKASFELSLKGKDQELKATRSAVSITHIKSEQACSVGEVTPESFLLSKTMSGSQFHMQKDVGYLTAEENKSGEEPNGPEDCVKRVVQGAGAILNQNEGMAKVSVINDNQVRHGSESVAFSTGIHGSFEPTSIVPSVHVPVVSTGALVIPAGTAVVHPVVQTVHLKERAQRVNTMGETKTRREPTSWTQEEKEKFAEIIKKHGKNWTLLHENLPAKSLIQIKTYFQNSKAKLGFAPEGTGCGSGRGGLGRKRKADDSDSSSNAGSLGQMGQQKVQLQSDDGGLKANSSVHSSNVSNSAGLVNNIVGSEALAYTALFGRKPSQVWEDPVSAQKVFNPAGLTHNSNDAGILPIFHPASMSVFASSNFPCPSNLSVQQSLVHSNAPKPQQLDNHRQQQQSVAPLAAVQQSQPQIPPVMIKQQSHVVQQQQEIVTRCQSDLQKQGVHLQKQATQQQRQQNSQALLQQQVVQHLQQQVTHLVLQQQQQHLQPQTLQCQQQQQLASQIPHHVQQVIHHLQTQLQQQSTNQVANQQQQVGNHQQPPSSHTQPSIQKGSTQQQQQSGQFPTQLFQLHTKSQAFLHQQQVPQQQVPNQQQQLLQQLHVQQQQLQLQRQQQQAHSQQQTPSHQLQKQMSQLQQPGFHFHEHQQQQLQHFQQHSSLRGVTQPSNAGSEVENPLDTELRAPSNFHQAACEDLQQPQMVSQDSCQASLKVQSTESLSRAVDIKLFGQSLLQQPSLIAQQNSTKSSAIQSNLSAITSTNSTSNPFPDSLSKNFGTDSMAFPSAFGRVGDPCYVSWPSISVVHASSSSSFVSGLQPSNTSKLVDAELEAQSVQEAVARITERFIAKGLEDGHALDLGALPNHQEQSDLICGIQDGKSLPNIASNMDRCGVINKISGSIGSDGDSSRSDCDIKSDQSGGDHGALLNRNRGPEYNSLMDAFMALAEWRSKQTISSSGRLTEELLNPSWESLQTGAGLDGGKGSGSLGLVTSLGQTYVGVPDVLQHVRDSLYYTQQHLMHLQGNAGVGSLWSSSLMHLNDSQNALVPTVSSFRPHGSSRNLSGTDEQARSELHDPDGSGNAVG